MSPSLKTTSRIAISLNYNEKKVAAGKAERILAENFLKDAPQLIKKDILARFRQRSSFNEKLHDHGLHASLNFGKTEFIEKEKLKKIADHFMRGLGFEDQPYVAYQHHDAGHTHLHIVACSVRADGSRLALDPKHYYLSHSLCRQIESEFNLEKSKRYTLVDQPSFAVDHAPKVSYGEPSLKTAVSNVLNTVFPHYNYTNLDEYNAILKQYNVTANPGLENTRLNKKGGLLYHALDDNGNHIGVPLKASKFLIKPTLKALQQKFEQNQSLREPLRERLHTAVEWALAGRAPNWSDFTKRLEKEGIAVLISKKAGEKENLFFIDHRNKSVFAGDSLGADSSLPSLRNRCASEELMTQQQIQEQQNKLKL